MLTQEQLDQALCKETDPALFDYPARDGQASKNDVDRLGKAASVCGSCGIRSACLAAGKASGDWSYRGGQLLRNGVVVHVSSRRRDLGHVA